MCLQVNKPPLMATMRDAIAFGLTADDASAAWRDAARAAVAALYETRSHPSQDAFVQSQAKRTVVRAGRRGGKTVGVARLALTRFLAGRRILYAAPTQDQIDRFWASVTRALAQAIEAKDVAKNETRHILEVAGTENRIRAKTAWDADSLRGDYADDLILDEWQLMNEDAWGVVGAPMLLDTNGDAFFVYTPPSFRTAGASKAHDPRHAAKLYATAAADDSGRWAVFHFRSHDNPYISQEALADIARDMTGLAYRQEILAEDVDEVPGALWTRKSLDDSRLPTAPDLARIVVGVDPGAGATDGDDTGIAVAGRDDRGHGYVVDDATCSGDPSVWPAEVIKAYIRHRADKIVVERNNGGAMVAHVIRQTRVEIDGVLVDGATLPIETVWASRGKHTRAEPVSVLWRPQPPSQPRAHLVGHYGALEDQLCTWTPGDTSPNNLDALVWAMTELFPNAAPEPVGILGQGSARGWQGGDRARR